MFFDAEDEEIQADEFRKYDAYSGGIYHIYYLLYRFFNYWQQSSSNCIVGIILESRLR